MPAPPQPAATRPAPLEHQLTVRRDGDALSADWDHGNPFPLTLPLAKPDLDELAWYLERYSEFIGAGDQVRARALERRLTDWGLALWQALFPGGEQNATYAGIRDRLDRGERVLLTLASDLPAFLIRPWEMLRDPRGPLALRGLTVRRRLLHNNAAALQQSPGLPLRLLLIVSRPQDTGFIDPRTSTRPVLDALDALARCDPPRVLIDFCEPPTFAQLERTLAAARRAGTPYHIVHFDGHGQYYPETGVGALCFERADGKTELIPGQRLGDLLSRLQVPLVLLEACRGAQVSDQPVFGAVAPALLHSGVGSVIAFSHAVHVAAATLVCERLYRELAGGATVGESLEESRAALLANRARWLAPGPDPETVDLQDWMIPQLYQGGTDPALVPVGRDAPTPAPAPAPAPRAIGFPPAPRYRFHGRARELLALERALHRHTAVLIHAGGGMGKTALTREAAYWWLRTGRFTLALFHSLEQGAGAEAVVRLIGEALGGADFATLSPDAQWTQALRLFRDHPVLLVWDNYESVLPTFAPAPAPTDGAQTPGDSLSAALDTGARADLERLYRGLTDDGPSAGGGRLLVTCRPQATGLAGIRELRLSGLARPDALHLLRGILERREIAVERPGWERAEIESLLERIEDHPLSIELIAPHLKDLLPGTIREELAERLGQFQDPNHAEGRNRSLLASLDFSRRRLSPAAQEALHWLGWFAGGMFERSLLDFSQIPPPAWSGIRAELTATALLGVEDLPWINTPYLKLHPTLADAAAPQSGDGGLVGRYIAVYLGVRGTIHGALHGSQPAAGMALMRLEQPNLRRAMTQAFDCGRHREGWALADTLGVYLQLAGRLRERDRLVDWVRGRMPQDRLDGATCAAILDHAWGRFTQGQAQQALDAVLDLERRLAAGELADGDPAFELALTRSYLGRILLNAGRPDLGLEPLELSIAAWRTLGDERRGNLSVTLGDLANALMALGRYDQALAAADEGLAINRALGGDQAVAVGLGQTAAILMDAGRHAESEARYDEALEAAERVGDLELQGTLLQHLGALQLETGRTAESLDTLRRALRSFQQSGDRGGEMQTCDLLGTAERRLGRLNPAEAWYRKSLELARGPADEPLDPRQVAGTRHNLGILLQTRAESIPASAPGSADPAAERDRLLAAAVTEIASSLAIQQEMGNRLGAALSHAQLGVLHRLRGDLERAETETRQALAIYEPLDHPETWRVYSDLAKIARARGDSTAAAAWQAQCDTTLEQLERRAAGPERAADPTEGDRTRRAAPDRQRMDALVALAQSVYQSRTQQRPPEPDTAEALAQLAQAPAPLGAFGRFLQALARGQDPAPPSDLPEPLAQIAAALIDALG